MNEIQNYIACPKLKGNGQKPITNLVGKKFGMLEVVGFERTKRIRWICRCDCGVTKSILACHLNRGLIRTCGCKRAELISVARQIILTGRTFGRWKVIGQSPVKIKTHLGRNIKWLCKCECGTESEVYAGHLESSASRSCGCLNVELTRAANTTHGGTAGVRCVEYSTWAGMHKRCRHHEEYAGRGICVCAGWSTYPQFLADMGRRPLDKTSIERIKNDRHYSCGKCEECTENQWDANCQWGTALIQNNNKRSNVKMTLNGETMNISQWARKLGLNAGTIYSRRKRGMTDAECLQM